MPKFISLGGYTFNADELLFAEDFTTVTPGGKSEDGVRIEFKRKGVIFLRGIHRQDLDHLLEAR